eukprot:352825-Chlamydomonas_euryale.AAC.16
MTPRRACLASTPLSRARSSGGVRAAAVLSEMRDRVSCMARRSPTPPLTRSLTYWQPPCACPRVRGCRWLRRRSAAARRALRSGPQVSDGSGGSRCGSSDRHRCGAAAVEGRRRVGGRPRGRPAGR